MALQPYEIVVRGNAGVGVRAAFRDCDITVVGDRTRLVTGLLDQAGLFGALDHMRGLGLEVLEVRRVEPEGEEPTDTRSTDEEASRR